MKLVALLHDLDHLVGQGRLPAAAVDFASPAAVPHTSDERAVQAGELRLIDFASLDVLLPVPARTLRIAAAVA